MDGLVLTAAGASLRFGGGTPKVLLPLAGTPVLLHALRAFTAALPHLAVAVTARAEDVGTVEALLPGARVVPGGPTRQASVERGVRALPPGLDVVLVHDAARPLLSPALVARVAEAARRDGAAVAGLAVSDSLHRLSADGRRLEGAVARAGLFAAQTPQAARAAWLLDALAQAAAAGREATDEVGLLTAAGYPVTPVEGEAQNLKLTRREDLALAEALLVARAGRPA